VALKVTVWFTRGFGGVKLKEATGGWLFSDEKLLLPRAKLPETIIKAIESASTLQTGLLIIFLTSFLVIDRECKYMKLRELVT
jgi:hypothetical protein